jgi:hypothetical protein
MLYNSSVPVLAVVVALSIFAAGQESSMQTIKLLTVDGAAWRWR